MMTVVTHIEIAEGQEPDWDAAMRERVATAKQQAGFVSVQLCIPVDGLNERVVIGTWQTRADWEAWHESGIFVDTRERMDRCEVQRKGEWWHEVLLAEQL
jgi:heme-degrading monooxygenase HmoA